jgi:hypothetical protein
MARYKYSENTKEVTDIYFDTETHGEYMGMEQGGEMKKVTTARIKEKLLGEIDGRLNTLEGADTVDGSVLKTVKTKAEDADFTDTSGLDSTTLAGAINEIYAEKAVANGLASLDATGKVPVSQLPVSAMEFKGGWDASSGAYPVTPDTGDFWTVSVAGTTEGVEFDAGDAIVYNGASWDKINKVEVASEVSYDNSTSGLASTDAQGAIDELDGRVDTAEGDILAHESRLDTTELTLARQGQDLASVKQTLQQGNGATLDFSDIGIVPLDARATGRANPTVEGLTATNEEDNGQFLNTLSEDWVTTSFRSTLAIVDGRLKITCTSDAAWLYGGRTNLSFKSGVTYCIVFDCYGNLSGDIEVRLHDGIAGSPYAIGTVSITTVDRKYAVVLTPTADCDTLVFSGYGDFELENDYISIDNLMRLNLTSIYGSGNEPSEADCAKIFSYFDGTKSIQLPARLVSRGANIWSEDILFDASKVYTQLDTGRNLGASPLGGFTENNIIKRIFLFSGTYYWKRLQAVTANARVLLVQDTYVKVSIDVIGLDSGSFVLSESGYYDVVFGIWYNSSLASTDIINLKLLSQHDIPYEPYTDSTLYIADNEEVRSVPAISDEVKVVNGQLVKVQNVSEDYTIPANFTLSKDTSPTTLTFSQSVRTIFDGKPTTISSVGFILSTLFRSASFSDLYGNTLDDEAISWTDDSSSNRMKLWIRINRSRLTTEDASGFNSWITATLPIIQYQLATPITNNLLTSGILQAKQNGTVYYEPYYEGSHQTDASSQITLPYEGTIDKLTGYDENLEPYEVPSTGYTLVGTTLTITGAVENEVFYVELSRAEPLAPELIVNTLNNDQVTLDSADGKYYQIGFTTTNGVPTVTATEVL